MRPFFHEFEFYYNSKKKIFLACLKKMKCVQKLVMSLEKKKLLKSTVHISPLGPVLKILYRSWFVQDLKKTKRTSKDLIHDVFTAEAKIKALFCLCHPPENNCHYNPLLIINRGFWGLQKFLLIQTAHEILTALHYKPLYNINRSEKWGKKYTSRSL